MKGLLEVKNLRAMLAGISLDEVLLHLPVESYLQRILDGKRPTLDQKGILEERRHRDAEERIDELRHLGCIDIRARWLV